VSSSNILEEILALPSGDRDQGQLELVKGWLESIRSPLVACMVEEQVYRICKQLVVIRAAENDLICRQGESADNAYVVLHGEVAVHMLHSFSKFHEKDITNEYGPKVNLLEAGSCFGELGALQEESTRTASVLAASPEVVLAMISHATVRAGSNNFEDVIRERVRTLRQISEFSRFTGEELLGIAYRMVSQRIAARKHVFTLNQNVAGVYILASGEVRLEVPVRMTGRTSKFEIPAPGFVGLEEMMSVANGTIKSYSYSAIATLDSVLLFLDKKTIHDLCLMSCSPLKKAGSKRGLMKRLSKTVVKEMKPASKLRQENTLPSSPRPATTKNDATTENDIERLCLLAKLFPELQVEVTVTGEGGADSGETRRRTVTPHLHQAPPLTHSSFAGAGLVAPMEADALAASSGDFLKNSNEEALCLTTMSEEALCLHARLNTLSFSPPGFYTNLSSRNNMAYRNTDKLSPRAGSPRKVHRRLAPGSSLNRSASGSSSGSGSSGGSR
jgi:CRP-like cAMP-binding protein